MSIFGCGFRENSIRIFYHIIHDDDDAVIAAFVLDEFVWSVKMHDAAAVVCLCTHHLRGVTSSNWGPVPAVFPVAQSQQTDRIQQLELGYESFLSRKTLSLQESQESTFASAIRRV